MLVDVQGEAKRGEHSDTEHRPESLLSVGIAHLLSKTHT
jgi:hypothetical protein